MPKHRSRIATREEFTKAYSLPMFRNPNVKFVVVKCEVCNPAKKVYNRAKFKRFESD